MPPMLRSPDNLHALLAKKTKLPFALVRPRTLRRYAKEMEWDERILKETYTTMPEATKNRQVMESEYAHEQAWQLIYSMYNQLNGMKDKLDWKHLDTNDKEVTQSHVNIQKMFNETFKTMHQAPVSLADMYAMIEVLKATNETAESNIKNGTDDLLTKEDTQNEKD